MKSLYITSVERFSGKTALCLTLGLKLKKDGYQVNYLKPLSLQPWHTTDMDGQEHIADEDAAFVKSILDLSSEPWELSPVVITPEALSDHILRGEPVDQTAQLFAAYEKASLGQDILLLEGGSSMREGTVVGLPTAAVTDALDTHVLAIVRYRDVVQVMDDVLALQIQLGPKLIGVVINRVFEEAWHSVKTMCVPFLEKKGVPVFGVLPEVRGLTALTVGDLIKKLDAEVLTRYQRPQALVENLTVGAMTAEAALSRFRQYSNKAVITGGDRTDIQLAALETSTTCLVLTGNLRPSPLVVKQAEEFGVTVLLTRSNTRETLEAIDRIHGKTRIGEIAKLEHFRVLLNDYCDCKRLYQALGLV